MKTELTIEESARLIELGVDPKLASKCNSTMKVCASGRGIIRLPESKPIFTLADILSILPSVIYSEERDILCSLTIVRQEFGTLAYYGHSSHTKVSGSKKYAHELIDCLRHLLIWCVTNGHLKTDKE